MIAERGEIVRKDLERELNISSSTAYHHITILTNVGLLKIRNKGKTIIYSLNREYFDSIVAVLDNYTTKGV